jgi:hypothetical protein
VSAAVSSAVDAAAVIGWEEALGEGGAETAAIGWDGFDTSCTTGMRRCCCNVFDRELCSRLSCTVVRVLVGIMLCLDHLHLNPHVRLSIRWNCCIFANRTFRSVTSGKHHGSVGNAVVHAGLKLCAILSRRTEHCRALIAR